ncbi:hypothetical protein [Nocardia wallacei]|uniref:hypothetical protein n=1 Tax=Nocardia wallacei TaxID=480035 RepID=UPI0024589BAB|nr:hypothetical protein [Nocardia wallacei]
MDGRSQGIAYPRHASTATPTHRSGHRNSRPRIAFSDATTVRSRIQDAADTLGLTGAREHALRAVLHLLCGWSRTHDDRIRIQQVGDAIVDLCGQQHRYDPKTIGRALRDLHREALITYSPARGRGRCATIAIHDRFLAGIQELARDTAGQVITFSRRPPYISKGVKNPPTPQIRIDAAGRPVGLKINPTEVRQVFAGLPAEYQALPKRLRWCLGQEIRRYLGRGWTAERILGILAAPLPAGVSRPLRLARWRLTHNMPGSGPRLAKLQRAWDRDHTAAQKATAATERQRRLDEVHAATTESVRARLLVALQARLPKRTRLVVDEAPALVHAARMATREFPGHELADALHQWLTAHLPETAAEAPESPHCVACGAPGGTVRDDLPLRSLVCDPCWTADQATAA